MKLKLENVTEEILNLPDIGFSLQPNTVTKIDTNSINLDSSRVILKYISELKIVVNNYDRDLMPTEAIMLISTGSIMPKDTEGKLYVHQTSRIQGTMTYWTGRGDKIDDAFDVGNGETLIIQHKINDPLQQSVYLDFNSINNKTSLHEGYFIWGGAKFGDFITIESVVNIVSYTAGENTNYNLYGGFLVVPAAGNGVIEITSDISNPCASGGSLVEVYTDETGYTPPAYWDADYNSSTGLFENIQPNYTATGEYNMYTVELVGNRFINSIPVLKDGFEMLQSSDSTYFPHGIRIKATIITTTDDHDWDFGGIMTMHRQKTS